MQREWRGIEGVQTDKRWIRACRPHRAEMEEAGQNRLSCARGCVVDVPAGYDRGLDLDECPFDVVEVKTDRPVSRGPGMEDWTMPTGHYDRSARRSSPGETRDERRETTKEPKGKVLETATFHSEPGHRIWISLERSKLVPFVVKIKHKAFEGPTTKGQLAAGESLEEIRVAFQEQITKAKEMEWKLGAPVTGLTEIPAPDEVPEVGGVRKRGRRKAA